MARGGGESGRGSGQPVAEQTQLLLGQTGGEQIRPGLFLQIGLAEAFAGSVSYGADGKGVDTTYLIQGVQQGAGTGK